MHVTPVCASPAAHWLKSVYNAECAQKSFGFRHAEKSSNNLAFAPSSLPQRPQKRLRALSDIDGDHSCIHKKKRRLRLFLITSRLSPEFSLPATNIVDRGTSKIAIWAKRNPLDQDLFRKAAILNSFQRRLLTDDAARKDWRRSLVETGREQRQMEMARRTFMFGGYNTPTRPLHHYRRPSFPPSVPPSIKTFLMSKESRTAPISKSKPDSQPPCQSPNSAYAHSRPVIHHTANQHAPPSPSPLGLSNYDALDPDDDIEHPYAYLDDEYADTETSPDHNIFGSDSPASLVSTLSTAPTGISEILGTPLQTGYAEFEVLDGMDAGAGPEAHPGEGEGLGWVDDVVLESGACGVVEEKDLVGVSPNFAAL